MQTEEDSPRKQLDEGARTALRHLGYELPEEGGITKQEEEKLMVDDVLPYPDLLAGEEVVHIKAEELAVVKESELRNFIRAKTGRSCPICKEPWDTHGFLPFLTYEKHQERVRDWLHEKMRLVERLHALVIKVDANPSQKLVGEKERMEYIVQAFEKHGATFSNQLQGVMNYQTGAGRELFTFYWGAKAVLYSIERMYRVYVGELRLAQSKFESLGMDGKEMAAYEPEAKLKFQRVREEAEWIESIIEATSEGVHELTKEGLADKLLRLSELNADKRAKEEAERRETAAPQPRSAIAGPQGVV